MAEQRRELSEIRALVLTDLEKFTCARSFLHRVMYEVRQNNQMPDTKSRKAAPHHHRLLPIFQRWCEAFARQPGARPISTDGCQSARPWNRRSRSSSPPPSPKQASIWLYFVVAAITSWKNSGVPSDSSPRRASSSSEFLIDARGGL